MTSPVTVLITSAAGETAGALALPAEVFDVQANIPLMHQVVVAQLAAARQGTHSTKTRGAVSGGGKKPYRQKGTGRARQGSTRAPQFTGGGVSHGPVPHGYAQKTPKKMKAAALRGALSDRARGGNVHVLSALVDGDAPSTKAAAATLAAVSSARNVLVVVGREDEAGWKSLRNVPTVHLLSSDQLNTYDVLISDDVVFTRAALDEFLQFARAEAATEVDVPAEAGAEAKARADVRAAEAADKAAAKAEREAAAAEQAAVEAEAAEHAAAEAEAATADTDTVTDEGAAEVTVTDQPEAEVTVTDEAEAEVTVTDEAEAEVTVTNDDNTEGDNAADEEESK
jgi:large subunit ribosomal protein L4